MALVKCPECGKENVSDSAESCPECGYGIRMYYDQIKLEEQRQEVYERKLQRVKMPDAPSKMNMGYGLAIFFGIGTLLGFATSPVMALIMLGFTCWTAYYGAKQYNNELDKYNLAKANFEKYQREMVKEQEQRAWEESLKTKCPNCGSTRIEKISTADRAVSVAMVGVASGKIGKQYKCRQCKHMW